MTDLWCDRIMMVIPSINGETLLARMLPTLRFKPANVLVLDQGSTDGTVALCERAGVEVLQLGTPHTYTRACNIGAEVARARGVPFLCVSNNDITFRTNVLAELLAEMERDPGLGIAAPSQVIIDEARGEEALSNRVFWHLDKMEFMHDFDPADPAVERLEADFCELTCALIRMSAVAEIGFLDDEYGFYHEDADFGFRLRKAGWNCAYLPQSQIDHFTSSTFGREVPARKKDYLARNRRYFANKHLGYGIKHDSYRLTVSMEAEAVIREFYPYVIRYGLIEEDTPDLVVAPPGTETPGYLYTTYEAPTVPGRWLKHRNRYAGLFTPSEHMRRLFADQGFAHAFRVPLGIEPDVFHPWGAARRLHGVTTYLAMLDGPDPALRSVLAAWHRFTAGGADARLVVCGQGVADCMGRLPDAAWRAANLEIRRFEAERVEVFEVLSPFAAEALAQLCRSVDFVLTASYGERATRSALGAMACGVPCIVLGDGPVNEVAVPWPPTVDGPAPNRQADPVLARLQDSFGLNDSDRAALGRAGMYKVRGQATLRHSAMGLHHALAHLQIRYPAHALRRLEHRDRAAAATLAPADAPPLRRIGRLAARRLATVGRLTASFGTSWYEHGIVSAGRSVVGEVQTLRAMRAQQAREAEAARSPPPRAAPRTAAGQGAAPRDGVLLIGYVEAQLGLGQSLRGLAQALAAVEAPFSIYPFGVGVEGRRTAPFMPERYDLQGVHATNVIEVTPDELQAVHAHIDPRHFSSSYNVLRTYWELGRAPEAWRAKLDGIDEIWAPNDFVADSFRHIFPRPITVVPPCVSLPAPTPDGQAEGRQQFGLDPDVFHFLFSFDYFSFPQRKNPMGVVRAFRRAFPDRSVRVGLVVKSTGTVDHHPALKKELHAAAAADGRIRIVDESLSRAEMLALMAASDCFVSLHRSEGFGLGMVESMALGKPVIATDYSGNTEFVRNDTAYPVPYRLRPVAPDEYVHTDNQVWAEPDEAACASAMAQVFANPAEAAERASAGQRFVQDRYSPKTVGTIAQHRLAEIQAAKTGAPKTAA